MFRKVLILFFILVLASLAVWAQEELPNDPTVNEDANACSEGGSMEGKCNVDFNEDGVVDEFELAWAWECGWYIIRLDAGIFSEIPERCQVLISAEVEDEAPAFCYVEVEPGLYFIFPARPNGTGNGNAKPESTNTRPDFPRCVGGDPRR